MLQPTGKPLSKDILAAAKDALERYDKYLASFGPEEQNLRKKV